MLQLATNQRPYIELSAAWSTYLASRPSKLRYNLRARQRQLAALGELRFEHYASPERVAANLPRAVALHARRWQGQHTSTTFSSSQLAQRFYLDACQRLATLGWLDLAALELDDRLVAFALTFKREATLFYYLPAFDPDYARYAPSATLLAHLIETACGRGAWRARLHARRRAVQGAVGQWQPEYEPAGDWRADGGRTVGAGGIPRLSRRA